MLDPMLALRDRLQNATRAALGDEAADADPAIHRSAHADYQADLALALARKLKKNPREVATAIAAAAAADDVIAAVAVSGPGFINLTLRPEYLAGQLQRMLRRRPPRRRRRWRAPRRWWSTTRRPNVAKEMHVGHLRSTIIGDALVRLLELPGAHRSSARTTSATGARRSAC